MAGHEENICIRLMAHVHAHYPWAKWHIFHVVNEGKRKPQYAAKLAKMGMLHGVSDYVVSHPRRFMMLFLEVKTPTGTPSQNQLDFIAAQRKAGHIGIVGYGYQECEYILDNWFSGKLESIRWLQETDRKAGRNKAWKARAVAT